MEQPRWECVRVRGCDRVRTDLSFLLSPMVADVPRNTGRPVFTLTWIRNDDTARDVWGVLLVAGWVRGSLKRDAVYEELRAKVTGLAVSENSFYFFWG